MSGFVPVPDAAVAAVDVCHYGAILDLYSRGRALDWGRFNVTERSLAARWRVSGRQVWAILEALEMAGLVTVEKGGKRRPTTLQIVCPVRVQAAMQSGQQSGQQNEQGTTHNIDKSEAQTEAQNDETLTRVLEESARQEILIRLTAEEEALERLGRHMSSSAIPAANRWRYDRERDLAWLRSKLTDLPDGVDVAREIERAGDWLQGQIESGTGKAWKSGGWKRGLGDWLKRSKPYRNGHRQSAPSSAADADLEVMVRQMLYGSWDAVPEKYKSSARFRHGWGAYRNHQTQFEADRALKAMVQAMREAGV